MFPNEIVINLLVKSEVVVVDEFCNWLREDGVERLSVLAIEVENISHGKMDINDGHQRTKKAMGAPIVEQKGRGA